MQDRLGSIGHYYPYGEAYAGSAPTMEAFATYYRDSSTLDYAQNRYYASSLARFTSPDPYRSSGGPADPGSWNRYAYVGNDPVNKNDPSGLDCQLVDSGTGIFMLLCSYSGDMGAALELLEEKCNISAVLGVR